MQTKRETNKPSAQFVYNVPKKPKVGKKMLGRAMKKLAAKK